MNNKSRGYNSIRNVVVSWGVQLAYIAITFFNRTIFVKSLGAEYTGINGLFSNLLSLFSLAELGIGNVMIFSLYGPLHDRDEEKISALLHFYKRIYIIIAAFIALIGVATMPFLGQIMDSSVPTMQIYGYYVIFLLNSVSSYFCAHKLALISADQKVHVVRIRTFIFQLIQNVLQVIILLQTHNFLLYLIIQLASTILTNVSLAIKANKMYPFIVTKQKIAKQDRSNISKKIKSTMVYKISVVIMNNTDNILISILVGTIFVGYYSNYTLIVSTITTLITLVISAISPSIGNLNASKNKERNLQVFYSILLIFHWAVAFCSIALFFLLNDFVALWIGEEYVLEVGIVLTIIINFYVTNVIGPVWMYREATGLFERVKFVMLVASVINIVLSIVLGKIFGMGGILIATAIARCLTTVWREPIILYGQVFNGSPKPYFLKQLRYLLLTIISALLTWGVTLILKGFGATNIIIKACVCVLVPNIVFFIANRNSIEWKNTVITVKRVFQKRG